MSDRIRRGMLIKNNGSEAVEVSLSSRQLRLAPDEEAFITPEEGRRSPPSAGASGTVDRNRSSRAPCRGRGPK
ncbi:hypothetical protein [Salinibacter ruber]|uniref:Uncharacterized protein n=1 Tax=Salinibacter ruber TaxID=146919 RepID=A0A9X2ZC35_9BACT|nr:hypothetical protein [Salinibacter ruber]MCS3612219.1 hypothetical protein [Salinibacter ruber]MCS3615275.1 hypothetical protein [Salinibacter ruber]MCS3784011.1 hypothetical protein [Salinibacter ruber]MCS4037615.1 hypothetical protein [Salinibacter ruber]